MKKTTLRNIFISMFTIILTLIFVGNVNADGTATFTLNNVQSDNSQTNYTYKISIDGVTGAIKYTIDGKEGYAVFNGKGEATITISSNSTITLYEIPLNKNYSIEQTSSKSGYKTLVNNVETSIATGVTSASNKVTFTNKNSDESSKKESTKEEKNPVTADPIVIVAAILIVASAGFIALRKLKVRRYE